MSDDRTATAPLDQSLSHGSLNESWADKALVEVRLLQAAATGFGQAAQEAFSWSNLPETLGKVAISAAVSYGMARGAPTTGLAGIFGKATALGTGTAFFTDVATNGVQVFRAAKDAWHSDRNWDRDYSVMQTSLGRFAFDSVLMTAGGVAGGGWSKVETAHPGWTAGRSLAASRESLGSLVQSPEHLSSVPSIESLHANPNTVIDSIKPPADPAELSASDIAMANAFKRSPAEVSSLRAEIRANGSDPASTLLKAMSNNRVLGIGEVHSAIFELKYPINPQRVFGAQMMESLKQAGATHLAVEADVATQPVYDEFEKTGLIAMSDLPNLHQEQDYVELLQAARKAKLKIVAVDKTRPATLEERDEFMAKSISDILSADAKNKVVFWVGSDHLFQPGNSAGARLAQSYSVHTVRDVTHFDVFNPLARLANVDKPVSVSMSDSPLAESFFQAGAKRWDELLIHPDPASR